MAVAGASRSLVRLSLTAVNMFSVANGTIETTEKFGRFVPLHVVFEVLTASAVTNGPTVSIGTNSTTNNNILVATNLGASFGPTVNGLYVANLAPVGVNISVAALTAIGYNVSIAATGTSGTMRIDVLGYYAS